MPNTLSILGIPVANMTMQETLAYIADSIAEGKYIHHGVVNASKVVKMQKDQELFDSVINTDLINADGAGIVWAAKTLGTPLPERVTGVDLMRNLVELSAEKKYKIFFFGAKEEVVKKVVDIYTETYSADIIAGYRNGYFKEAEAESIAEEIANSGANILFVAISSPMKEIFLHRHKEILKKVNFIMGVGGSFDVVAGKVKRAPLWVQNIGMEGAARFIQEPRKMWRRFIIDNVKFVSLVYKTKFFK